MRWFHRIYFDAFDGDIPFDLQFVPLSRDACGKVDKRMDRGRIKFFNSFQRTADDHINFFSGGQITAQGLSGGMLYLQRDSAELLL